jgi:hypothetical protein
MMRQIAYISQLGGQWVGKGNGVLAIFRDFGNESARGELLAGALA